MDCALRTAASRLTAIAANGCSRYVRLTGMGRKYSLAFFGSGRSNRKRRSYLHQTTGGRFFRADVRSGTTARPRLADCDAQFGRHNAVGLIVARHKETPPVPKANHSSTINPVSAIRLPPRATLHLPDQLASAARKRAKRKITTRGRYWDHKNEERRQCSLFRQFRLELASSPRSTSFKAAFSWGTAKARYHCHPPPLFRDCENLPT